VSHFREIGMKYVVIAILALVLGGLIGRAIWKERPQQPVDPVQVIVTQLKTHAVISHERQLAIWYRSCPEVLGKTPTIFIAWPATISYQLELQDVQVTRSGSVIKVRTAAIHADEPSVPTDFMDYLSTKSIFTFANEEELVNHEIGKASPIARYLTTYFLDRDPSLRADFSAEVQGLVQHLAAALGVTVTQVDVEIPAPQVTWPKLPKIELCPGSMASVNGVPFARIESGYTVPIGFRPQQKGHAIAASAASPADAPKGIASVYATQQK
jgi:hypothetical protein